MRLKRTFIGLSVVFMAVAILGVPPSEGKKTKPPCSANEDLKSCPDQGCGDDFDPNLNRRKNIRADDQEATGPATPRTLQWMKALDDPENFKKGGSREELKELGEGEKISVLGYLLMAKAELSGESCNCGLHKPEWTDNHLVLVTKATVRKFPSDTEDATDKEIFHSRELESITAEFTPRVRLPRPAGGSGTPHPNFTRSWMF